MITEERLSLLRQQIKTDMKPSRYQHTLGVEREMRALARFFLPEMEKEAAAAGLLHDITKAWTEEEQLRFCKARGLKVSEDERLIPALLHAKTAAALIPGLYPDLATEAILSAISKHTAASPVMSVFDALLYIADYTEEGREYPSCKALRQTLHRGMEQTEKEEKAFFLRQILLNTYDESLAALKRLGRTVAVATVEARQALLQDPHYFS